MPAYKDDNFLLKRIAQGDPTGMSDLYDRYKNLVFSIAFHILGNQEDAEEVTLDVFGKVWEKAGAYTAPRATVKTWLTAIARNQSIDLLRRRNVRFTAQNPSWADACLDCMPAPDGQESSFEFTVMRKEMVDALAQLPSNQREALALAYFKGLSHSQIAEALAEPLGTVKTRIRSALQKLHKIMLDNKKNISVKSNFN